MPNIKPILRYPGAKWNLAEWIISYFPPHTTYLEPFFGSGAVFFNKAPSKVETINDIDGNVVNLFKVLREDPEGLARLIELTPWSREEYYASYEQTENAAEKARRFLVRCWQAFGTKTSDRTGWKSILKADGPYMPKIWNTVPNTILELAERLKGVQIENQTAVKVIGRYKTKDVLIYADPPYLLSTRSKRIYACEMKDGDHVELLETLNNHPGPVILSGYSHPMYDNYLSGWSKQTMKAQAELGRTREEVLWINPIAADMIMPSLF